MVALRGGLFGSQRQSSASWGLNARRWRIRLCAQPVKTYTKFKLATFQGQLRLRNWFYTAEEAVPWCCIHWACSGHKLVTGKSFTPPPWPLQLSSNSRFHWTQHPFGPYWSIYMIIRFAFPPLTCSYQSCQAHLFQGYHIAMWVYAFRDVSQNCRDILLDGSLSLAF